MVKIDVNRRTSSSNSFSIIVRGNSKSYLNLLQNSKSRQLALRLFAHLVQLYDSPPTTSLKTHLGKGDLQATDKQGDDITTSVVAIVHSLLTSVNPTLRTVRD